MVHIYDLLAKLGGPNGVIRQTEFFLYTNNDRETLDRCRELGHQYPECTGWIRADKGDFRLVREAGLKETGMLTSCSDYHIFQKLKFKSRQQCMDAYCDVVGRRLRGRHPAALPPGGRHPGRHRRLRAPLLRAADADERAGARAPVGQDPPVRHDGLRRQLPGRRAAAEHSQADLQAEPRGGRAQRPAGMARAQRLPQGAHQRAPRPGSTAATR